MSTPNKPATSKKALPSLDDLLGPEDAKALGISREALKDLAKLDAQMRKNDTGEERIRLDEGKPVRVVIFTTRMICACGVSYESPLHTFAPQESGDEVCKSLQCAMLKRVFHGSTLRAIYSPLPNHEAFLHLPHEVETREEHVMNCPACFTKPRAATSVEPAQAQKCCVYCRGDHELHECIAHGHKDYAEALRDEVQAAKQLELTNKEQTNVNTGQ